MKHFNFSVINNLKFQMSVKYHLKPQDAKHYFITKSCENNKSAAFKIKKRIRSIKNSGQKELIVNNDKVREFTIQRGTGRKTSQRCEAT